MVIFLCSNDNLRYDSASSKPFPKMSRYFAVSKHDIVVHNHLYAESSVIQDTLNKIFAMCDYNF